MRTGFSPNKLTRTASATHTDTGELGSCSYVSKQHCILIHVTSHDVARPCIN